MNPHPHTDNLTSPRRRGLTRPDKSAPVTADLIRRDFTASRPDQKWCGDFKQIPTLEGPVYLGTVEDLFSRWILGFGLSDTYPTAELAQAAVNMALDNLLRSTPQGSVATTP